MTGQPHLSQKGPLRFVMVSMTMGMLLGTRLPCVTCDARKWRPPAATKLCSDIALQTQSARLLLCSWWYVMLVPSLFSGKPAARLPQASQVCQHGGFGSATVCRGAKQVVSLPKDVSGAVVLCSHHERKLLLARLHEKDCD